MGTGGSMDSCQASISGLAVWSRAKHRSVREDGDWKSNVGGGVVMDTHCLAEGSHFR